MNDRPAQEAAGTYDEPLGLLPKHVYLGRESYCHHLDRDANIVIRFDDTNRAKRCTHLADHNFNDYLLFMAEGIGWRTRKQTGTFGALMRLYRTTCNSCMHLLARGRTDEQLCIRRSEREEAT